MSRDFEPEIQQLADLMRDFMNTQIIPSEPAWAEQRDELGLNSTLPIVEELRRKSARRGLWNLLQPQAAGISHVESAKIARITGWSPLLAPESINSQDPDYGNMNVLYEFANEAQRDEWLEPLFDGLIRSGWAMSESEELLAGRKPGEVIARREGDEFVLNGHVNFVAGVADSRCAFFALLAQTRPAIPTTSAEQSVFIVPTSCSGISIEESVEVSGYLPQLRLSPVTMRNVRIPAANLVGELGDGPTILATRLRLGRINRAMRSLGMADRALSNVAHQHDPDEQASVWLRQSALVIGVVENRILALAERLDTPGAQLPGNTEISTAAEEAHSLALSISREANHYLQGYKGEDSELITYFTEWIKGMRAFDASDVRRVDSFALLPSQSRRV